MISTLLFVWALDRVEAVRQDKNVTAKAIVFAFINMAEKYKDGDEKLIWWMAIAEVESGYKLDALNKTSHAYGPMQIMPLHMRGLNKHNHIAVIQRGVEVFEDWVDLREGNMTQALMYYNGGYRGHASSQAMSYAKKVRAVHLDMLKQLEESK